MVFSRSSTSGTTADTKNPVSETDIVFCRPTGSRCGVTVPGQDLVIRPVLFHRVQCRLPGRDYARRCVLVERDIQIRLLDQVYRLEFTGIDSCLPGCIASAVAPEPEIDCPLIQFLGTLQIIGTEVKVGDILGLQELVPHIIPQNANDATFLCRFEAWYTDRRTVLRIEYEIDRTYRADPQKQVLPFSGPRRGIESRIRFRSGQDYILLPKGGLQ